MTKKAVILLSGGLDSTTCLAIAKNQGYDCYAISVNYGQKHQFELKAAHRIAEYFRVKSHKVISFSLGALQGSSLTDSDMPIPTHQTPHHEIPSTYVPARNTIFLSLALGYAETLQADAIFIGANAVDYSGYPDCRPAYFEAFQNMANLATKSGVSGHTVTIETPILNLSKSDIIQMGTSLGVDYGVTVSCYQASNDGLACGECDACVLRKKGFEQANIPDPTHYQR